MPPLTRRQDGQDGHAKLFGYNLIRFNAKKD